MHGVAASTRKPLTLVKLARILSGRSQSEVARELGVTSSHLSKIEKGERPAGRELAVRLVNLLIGGGES